MKRKPAWSRSILRILRTDALAAGVLFILSCIAQVAAAASLSWDASGDSRVTGYTIGYGSSSRSYTTTVDVGKQLTYSIPTTFPQGSTMYFAVRAYDAGRNYSAYSNEVAYKVPTGAPVASFSATPSSGTAPLTVTFRSVSSGSITSYAWNYGDGTSGSGATSTHIYTAAGTYSATLTVTGPGGTSKSSPTTITVASSTNTSSGMPIMRSPASGSVLPGSSATFSWTANGAPVTEWWLYAGSSIGAKNYVDTGSLGASLSKTVSGLPTNGSAVYVRLWFKIAGAWQSADYRYTAAATAAAPAITSPYAGSTLPGSSASFSWTANGAAVTEWWLYAGSSLGANNYVDSGSLGTRLSTTLSGLPGDGSRVYLRLWFKIGGVWQSRDFQYVAGSKPVPGLGSPATASVLPGSSATFKWTANGTPVTEWWLYLGSAVGARNYLDSGSLGTSLSYVAYRLPTDGSPVYARLWYKLGGVWQWADYWFTAYR